MCEPGKLYGVSVGPGDPELLTLKAVRVITTVGFLAVPDAGSARRTALGIISDYARDQRIIDCKVPMTTDQAAIDAAMDQTAAEIRTVLDAGDDVAMITLGDAGVYSSFYSVCDRLRPLGYQVEVVPGVTSFCAAAARLGQPLCRGRENLLVVSATGGVDDDVLSVPANKVCMKAGKSLGKLEDSLRDRGELGKASLVANVGMDGEVVAANLEELDQPTGYFSVVLVREDRHGE